MILHILSGFQHPFSPPLWPPPLKASAGLQCMLVKYAQLPGWTRESQQAAACVRRQCTRGRQEKLLPRKSHISKARCKVEWPRLGQKLHEAAKEGGRKRRGRARAWLEMTVMHAQAILNEISPKDRKKHARALPCCAARRAPPLFLSYFLPSSCRRPSRRPPSPTPKPKYFCEADEIVMV